MVRISSRPGPSKRDGYNKKVLPWAWLALVSGLTGIEVELKEPVPSSPQIMKTSVFEETKEVIKRVKRNLKGYWRCFD